MYVSARCVALGIEVHASNNPVLALSEFKSNFYDLILPDINIGIMIEQQRVNAM